RAGDLAGAAAFHPGGAGAVVTAGSPAELRQLVSRRGPAVYGEARITSSLPLSIWAAKRRSPLSLRPRFQLVTAVAPRPSPIAVIVPTPGRFWPVRATTLIEPSAML